MRLHPGPVAGHQMDLLCWNPSVLQVKSQVNHSAWTGTSLRVSAGRSGFAVRP